MSDPKGIGERIRQRREELNLSLSALADKSEVAKGYLWRLEHGESEAPSGRTLYRIAKALGTTMSDLLGTRLLVEAPTEIPPSLLEFAQEADLSESDVRMLATISFRGEQPQESQAWALIWQAIKASVPTRAPRRR